MAGDSIFAAMPFTGVTLDREVTRRRDTGWLAARFRDPSARFVAAGADGVLLDGVSVARLALDPGELPADPILLGLDDGRAVFAVDLDAPGRQRALGEPTPLRDAAALLSVAEAGLAAYAAALLAWHRTHPFCSRCAGPTVIVEAGASRRCPCCGAHHFPRTDPVVIMVVTAPGHVLLGRHARWTHGRYSALAGYVSPGESLEEAVVREVREEAMIEARDPAYFASQPWPFPGSLMVGFHARAEPAPPVPRDGELEDVRWFSVGEVRAALAGRGRLGLPPSIAIARRLIEAAVAVESPAPDA
jgi:NAD+ diphosphatase